MRFSFYSRPILYWLFWIFRVFKELNRLNATRTSGGKAVGFMFIPVVNVFWFFIVWIRLYQGLQKASRDFDMPLKDPGLVFVAPLSVIPSAAFYLATGQAFTLPSFLVTLVGLSVSFCSVQANDGARSAVFRDLPNRKTVLLEV